MDPGGPFVVRARTSGLAVLAGLGAVLGFVLAFATSAVVVFGAPATIAGLWAGQVAVDRGRVQRVELHSRGDVVLRTGGGVRRFARSDVGGVGFTGTVIAGRLSTPFGAGPGRGSSPPPRVGRLVLLAPDGNVRGAWRAPWLAVEELERACRAAGLPWRGEVDVASLQLARPPATAGPTGPRPDPAKVRAAVRAIHRRSRVVLVRCLQIWLAGLAVTWVLHVAGARRPLTTVPEAVAWIGGFGLVFVLGSQPLRSRAARAAAKATAGAAWELADVAVIAGGPSDPSARVVVVLDPDRGSVVDSWLVDPGATSLWLQATERRRLHLTVAPDGRSAVAADEPVERLAALRRSLGLGKADAIHRWARAQGNLAGPRAQ